MFKKIFLMVLFGFLVLPVSGFAESGACAAGDVFNRFTGERCASVATNMPAGCVAGANYSSITGEKCSSIKSPTVVSDRFCYNFTHDLGVGVSSGDTVYLKKALGLEGFSTKDFDGQQEVSPNFTERLASSVSQFQAKYGISQTGYVGPITRAKLNALYQNCNIVEPKESADNKPYITAVKESRAIGDWEIWGRNLTGFYTGAKVYIDGNDDHVGYKMTTDLNSVETLIFGSYTASGKLISAGEHYVQVKTSEGVSNKGYFKVVGDVSNDTNKTDFLSVTNPSHDLVNLPLVMKIGSLPKGATGFALKTECLEQTVLFRAKISGSSLSCGSYFWVDPNQSLKLEYTDHINSGDSTPVKFTLWAFDDAGNVINYNTKEVIVRLGKG